MPYAQWSRDFFLSAIESNRLFQISYTGKAGNIFRGNVAQVYDEKLSLLDEHAEEGFLYSVNKLFCIIDALQLFVLHWNSA